MIRFDLLRELTETPGLPGREAQVAELVRANLPSPPWLATSDALGNLVAHLPGKGGRLVLVAHMDEVGLLVRRITPDGFLRVERLGGMSVRALAGSRLDLWTEKGRLPAHAGLLPQHLENNQLLELKDIYIDIGAASKAEVENWGVRVGDGLTWATNLERRGENGLVGKALDDRLGCLALIELAHRLGAEQPACDLYLAFVVQEETSLEGSAPAIRTIAPDYVIGVDGTLAFDTPDLEGHQSEIRLGHGPALKLFDALRGKGVSYLPDGGLVGRLRRLAERHELPLQSEVVVGISTALSPIPFALQGIATAALSIPIRYHHSGVETADRRDVDRLIQLLLGLARASDS